MQTQVLMWRTGRQLLLLYSLANAYVYGTYTLIHKKSECIVLSDLSEYTSRILAISLITWAGVGQGHFSDMDHYVTSAWTPMEKDT